MFKTGKLSSKGVVAIPVKLRTLLDVKEGDTLEFEVRGEEVVVRGVKRKSVMDAFESLDITFTEPLIDTRKRR